MFNFFFKSRHCFYIILVFTCCFTGWPVKHECVFLVPWEMWLVQWSLLYLSTLEKTLFTRYQQKTAMFNWSPCIGGDLGNLSREFSSTLQMSGANPSLQIGAGNLLLLFTAENRFSKFLFKGVPTPTALVKTTGTFWTYISKLSSGHVS